MRTSLVETSLPVPDAPNSHGTDYESDWESVDGSDTKHRTISSQNGQTPLTPSAPPPLMPPSSAPRSTAELLRDIDAANPADPGLSNVPRFRSLSLELVRRLIDPLLELDPSSFHKLLRRSPLERKLSPHTLRNLRCRDPTTWCDWVFSPMPRWSLWIRENVSYVSPSGLLRGISPTFLVTRM
ncbi:uncharacterized protein PG986_005547 [Apiospora aurea]|uniref:F-box domain-containing protein n=1 Tax=Apiospora aurea TaxID=335848 RepID=A0ABR1QHW0_9PEZI